MSVAVNIAIGAGIAAACYAGYRLWKGQPSTPPPASQPPVAPPEPSSPVAPAIRSLITSVNAQWPNRSRASDGTLPSAAHHAANPTSDHESGNALDITRDRTNGPNLYDLAEVLKKDGRVKYLIFDNRIWNPIVTDAWRPYQRTAIQTDTHTEHMHVSIRASDRDDGKPWDLSGVRTGETLLS